ncbi:hypothetical protein ACFQFQ_24935 [Sulfitobacter porphyrae]|uniref:Solute-binding protein family 5 domain-containing protein n=1 Tax=Sulfitobacter porphyrae TaxID=1246864 RepID=A0ABW2B9W4_9RHOB|nr:hypothetical protein GCM10007928_38330 [Sulfitobacter porphyrae]
MLSKVGIRTTLNALPSDQWSPMVSGHKSDFYLLGYGTPTTDSLFMAQSVFQSGPFNAGYQNDEIDALIEAAQYETDEDARNRMMTEIFAIAKADSAIAPLHYQTVIWALVKGLEMPVDPDNIADFRYAVMN